MNRFENKTVLVTGGASGIGRATVERLTAEGACVMIADRNTQKTEEFAEQLRQKGYQAKATYYNANDMASGGEIVKKTLQWQGTIDCVVNNVGGSDLSRDLNVAELDMEYFDEVFHLNLKSMLSTIRAALPAMIEKGTGNIVNVASIGGLTGDFRGSLYGMSKAGVINLTRYVATQFGHKGIRCNSVAPGLILTPAVNRNLPEQIQQIFLKYNTVPYLGKAEDIAATIAFLASDDARYISGQTIVVDGGMECHNPTIYDIQELIKNRSILTNKADDCPQ